MPAPASASELGYPTPTAQARAIGSEFLIAPTRPPVRELGVCIVDSGFDPAQLPDMTESLLTRLSYDDASPDDTSDIRHGTLMARIAGAAVNGRGMVGIWPGVRLITVRASIPSQQAFPYSGYYRGIDRCRRHARDSGVGLAAISLSLGTVEAPTAAQVQLLRDVVKDALELGISVLAAVGNHSGAVDSPAREPGVLGVGAAHAVSRDGAVAGNACAFSARGEGLDVIAPGCGLDQLHATDAYSQGAGTSQAAVIAAAVLAAGRAYAPNEVGRQQAEDQFIASGAARGGFVDAAGFFTRLGIDPARVGADPTLPPPVAPPATMSPTPPSAAGISATTPTATSGSPGVTEASTSAPSRALPAAASPARLPRPRLTLSWGRNARVRVVLRYKRPAGAVVRVRMRVLDVRGRTVKRVATLEDSVWFRISAAARRMSVRLVDESGSFEASSRWVSRTIPRGPRRTR